MFNLKDKVFCELFPEVVEVSVAVAVSFASLGSGFSCFQKNLHIPAPGESTGELTALLPGQQACPSGAGTAGMGGQSWGAARGTGTGCGAGQLTTSVGCRVLGPGVGRALRESWECSRVLVAVSGRLGCIRSGHSDQVTRTWLSPGP